MEAGQKKALKGEKIGEENGNNQMCEISQEKQILK